MFECMLYTGSLFWGREGEGKGDNFSIREAAANFSYPVPLGWLPLLPSNRRFERIEFCYYPFVGREKGQTRNEVNSRRQYTVRFVFETLDDDLSITKRGVKPRECAPTEEGEERPEGGNSRLFRARVAIGFTLAFPAIPSAKCRRSTVLQLYRDRSYSNLKVLSASSSLLSLSLFFHFSLIFFFFLSFFFFLFFL